MKRRLRAMIRNSGPLVEGKCDYVIAANLTAVEVKSELLKADVLEAMGRVRARWEGESE